MHQSNYSITSYYNLQLWLKFGGSIDNCDIRQVKVKKCWHCLTVFVLLVLNNFMSNNNNNNNPICKAPEYQKTTVDGMWQSRLTKDQLSWGDMLQDRTIKSVDIFQWVGVQILQKLLSQSYQNRVGCPPEETFGLIEENLNYLVQTKCTPQVSNSIYLPQQCEWTIFNRCFDSAYATGRMFVCLSVCNVGMLLQTA